MAWYDTYGNEDQYPLMSEEDLAALYSAAQIIYGNVVPAANTPAGTIGIPAPTIAPMAPVVPAQPRTYPTMDRSADGPLAAPTAHSVGSYAPPMSDAESAFIRRYVTAVNTRPAPASAPVGPSGPVPSTTGMPRRDEVANANAFEERLGGYDRGKNVGSQVNQTYIPDTGTGTVDQSMAVLYAALGLNPDGSPRNTNGGGGGGGGAAQVVLSPQQVQSLVDSLGQQTMVAGQGVGQAYDSANREMAQLMRQYSRAEKMNRAGAQGTLSAFGAPKSAYKVGDFGAPEMLAGARAGLIGNKAAEMSNWSNQQALYKQLLKDMGG